jgi:hypothetical protein
LTSKASLAALSGPASILITDPAGNVAAVAIKDAKGKVMSATSVLSSGLSGAGPANTKAFTGVAMAFAMVGTPMVLPNEKIAIAVNWGSFAGANGSAMSAAMRIYHNVQLNGSFGYGFTDSLPGGRVGLRFGF